MADTLPEPFGDEIKGIAAVSGVPLGKKTTRMFSDAYIVTAFLHAQMTFAHLLKCRGSRLVQHLL